MVNKVFYALYDDDDILLDAAKGLVSKGVRVNDVFSPFPIHGIDPVIGVTKTRLAIVSFIFGLFGLILALVGMRYFMIIDWPMNIGGKPNNTLMQNILAFIPISFEFTVLCAAHGMGLTYLIRNKTLPGMPATNPDPRTTNDHFSMKILQSENTQFSTEEMEGMLRESGLVELNQKDI
jgi:hypothetical protein